jgi:hypothetical protein
LHETIKQFSTLLCDEWARNEALTIILQQNRIQNVEQRTELAKKAQERFQPVLARLEKDVKEAWIEAVSNIAPSNSGRLQ